MTKRLRVFAVVLFLLAIFTGTVSAYNSDDESNDEDITFLNNIPVIINVDGAPRMVSTDKTTVGELLDSLDIDMDAKMASDIDESEPLRKNMTINLSSKEEKFRTETTEINFKTKEKKTDELLEGEERIVQKGVKGIIETTYKETYSGSKLLESEEINKETTQEPIDEIIEIGTKKPVVEKASANKNAPANFSKEMKVTATGYTPYDPGCNGVTYSGTTARYGVIAVDPNVIPLGTRVFVPGYGEAIAEDIGGAIKGNRIDLCYETTSEAYRWGVKDVTIYILD